jgi:hypothetical protein
MKIDVEEVTYFCWEEPEEQIGVVLLVNGEEARITGNVLRNWPTSDSRQRPRFLNIAILNVRCEDQPGTHIAFNRERTPLDMSVPLEIR